MHISSKMQEEDAKTFYYILIRHIKKSGTKKNKKTLIKKHTKLYRHPNPNKSTDATYYVENRIYLDDVESFSNQIYPWKWNKNDKRKIKRLKKRHRTR